MVDGTQLIIQAFMQAKNSGKSDWYRMTTAVLKNRLLDVTNRKFTEAAYGASSLIEFVSLFSNILDFDNEQTPPMVELKPEERLRLDANLGTPGHIRIRRDLWRAVFDRSSGNTYYWLPEIEVVATSPAPAEGNCSILPTIDAETDGQWRQSFIDILPTAPDHAKEWARSLLPLSQLPSELRYEWNRFLIDRVYRRLSDWFQEQELIPPSDFTTEVAPRQDRRTTDLDTLRRLVKQVVDEMTEEELSQLSLPPRAVLKAMNRKGP